MSLADHFQLDPTSPSYLAFKHEGGQGISKHPAGAHVVHEHCKGYWQATFQGVTYLAHRVVYELVHGWCPPVLDHKDTNKKNNHPDNLRPADKDTNQWNHGLQTNSTTKVKGLTRHVQSGGWLGQIKCNGKRHTFYNKDRTVVEAWLTTKRAELHGEYANHG